MSDRILTLFGEEMAPEQPKAPKGRAKKKTGDKEPEQKPQEQEAASVPEQPAQEARPAPVTEQPKPVTPVKQPRAESAPPVEEEKKFLLPEDWKGDKRYYTIGEVAELFKVKTSHIRFWTNEFKLKVRTTRKGDRMYTPDQVRELKAIHHLVKERGFTLTGAKAKLKAQNKKDVETIDLKKSLIELKGKLVIIRNQLKPGTKEEQKEITE